MDDDLVRKRAELDRVIRERQTAQQGYLEVRDEYNEKADLLKRAREEGDRVVGASLRSDLEVLRPALEADRSRVRHLADVIRERAEEYRALRERVRAGRQPADTGAEVGAVAAQPRRERAAGGGRRAS